MSSMTVPAPQKADATFDPSPPLLAFLRGALGPDVRYAEPPASFGAGFDTLIYGFRIEGPSALGAWSAPLVLRVYTTAMQDAKALREASLQRFAAERGYPALTPLAVETSDGMLGLPFMILERMPGGMMLERFIKRPWRGPRLFAEMGALHAALHRVPTERVPLETHDEPSVDLFLRSLRAMIIASNITDLDDPLAWLERHAHAARDDKHVLLHGDFHPLNIIYAADGSERVIDWSDADLGDRHADVARTTTVMSFAHIVANNAVERIALKAIRGRLRRWYLRGYERAFPMERRRLAYWEAAQALRGIVQIMESYIANDETITRRLPPSLIGDARRYFERKCRECDRLETSSTR
jgi:aminoglycoside phosphotransferase (APT) family kinase protein